MMPVPCPHGVIFFLFIFFALLCLAICLATIFIKMHEIAMPIQIVLPIAHTHTHIYLNAVTLIDSAVPYQAGLRGAHVV